eukprot:scaffold7379_cov366-Prasinococcus_capsulatus_cf.AAC.7
MAWQGRSIAGWYRQQFVKMAVAQRIPDLSDHFLLWDLDMIPLVNELALFVDPMKVRGLGEYHRL